MNVARSSTARYSDPQPPDPGQQAAYLVRVRYPGQREALCRLKVEITVDEPILHCLWKNARYLTGL